MAEFELEMSGIYAAFRKWAADVSYLETVLYNVAPVDSRWRWSRIFRFGLKKPNDERDAETQRDDDNYSAVQDTSEVTSDERPQLRFVEDHYDSQPRQRQGNGKYEAGEKKSHGCLPAIAAHVSGNGWARRVARSGPHVAISGRVTPRPLEARSRCVGLSGLLEPLAPTKPRPSGYR